MLTAEVQRIVFLIGLAVTAYLMVLAWNQDYHHSSTGPGVSESPLVAPDPVGAVSHPIEGVVTPSTSDVPEASPARPADVAATPEAAGTADGFATATPGAALERLIRIDTQALSVWIDRLGGDIVRVQLPLYPLSLEQQDVPYVLLDNGAGHTYMAQTGLVGRDGLDARPARPLYSTAASSYAFQDAGGAVVLTTDADGVSVSKTFAFTRDDYLIRVAYEVKNLRATAIETGLFAQLKRDGGDPVGQSGTPLGPSPYVGAALTTPEERYLKLPFDDLEDAPFQQDVSGGWISILQHYFLTAWIADAETLNRYYGRKREDGIYLVGFTGPVATIAPGEQARFSAAFYAGPKDQAELEAVAANLNLTVDYGFLWWLAAPLFQIMKWLHGVVSNWGLAIILLTVLVKAVLYPLSAASYRSMANMRRVAPQLKRLQERHADDRQKLSQEMMALYQKEKVNPLGGCLPMLVQMPVFLALYWVLFESVELRQAPFFLWIADLSVMDPYFVLPILMGASMFVQMQLNPPVPDPVQAKVMKFMPIMFTVMFLFFPSGLVLYWLVNNVLSIAQQWLITRHVERSTSGAR